MKKIDHNLLIVSQLLRLVSEHIIVTIKDILINMHYEDILLFVLLELRRMIVQDLIFLSLFLDS